MNYLIQNFHSTYIPLKISLRLWSVILARNSFAIYSLIFFTTRFNTPVSLTVSNYYFLKNSKYGFDNLLDTLFSSPRLLKFTPKGVNFASSAYFKALADINLLINNSKPSSGIPTEISSHFTYPYPVPSKIVMTPTAKKSFVLAFYKLLHMCMDTWFMWPRRYSALPFTTDVTNYWLMLLPLNKYFLKVYTL